jgi:heterotetrameric sarcosine oxidase delta subunit
MSAVSAPFPTCTDTTMLRIKCPWCGERDETEFRYKGDATRARPPAGAGVEAFTAFVFERDNPRGWHLEWWLHTGGCRRLLRVARHTVSHEIHAVGTAQDVLELPEEMDAG